MRVSSRQALYSLGANNAADDQQYGLNLDLFRMPTIWDKRIWGARSVAEDRNSWLQLRLGYRYEETLNGSAPSVQYRLLVEATVRRTFWGVRAADRSRTRGARRTRACERAG